MDKGCVNNERGVVLVMVLLILVATILIGIAVTRSSFFESKIAGNVRQYKNEFYATEGAADYVISEFDAIVSDMNLAKNSSVDLTSYLHPEIDSILNDATITITYIKKGTPPVSDTKAYGMSAGSAYYYRIDSQNGDQRIESGVWKYFPNP
jgi:Tfp pilus assembly protein PilX